MLGIGLFTSGLFITLLFLSDVFNTMDLFVTAFGFNNLSFFWRSVDGNGKYCTENAWAADLWVWFYSTVGLNVRHLFVTSCGSRDKGFIFEMSIPCCSLSEGCGCQCQEQGCGSVSEAWPTVLWKLEHKLPWQFRLLTSVISKCSFQFLLSCPRIYVFIYLEFLKPLSINKPSEEW